MFNIGHILTLMHNAGKIDADARPNVFKDTGLNRWQSIMLHATRLMVGAVKQCRCNVEMEGMSSIEKTSMWVKDQSRKVPEPVVVLAEINGHQVQALVDTGSMADFISMTVVEQLRLQKEVYAKPLSVQLVVHGSRSKVNCGTTVKFQYQSVRVCASSPINPDRLSNQCRTGADRCTPTLPR